MSETATQMPSVTSLPAFPKMVPITCPTLPGWDELQDHFYNIVQSGMVTNSTHVRAFEARAAETLQVRNAIAVSSCTNGLLLVLRTYRLRGEVIVPSFTFMATGHVLRWNDLTPKFVDIDPRTFNIDPKAVESAITEKTTAILGVHLFGNPAATLKLEEIARTHGLKLIFDSAHAFGSSYGGKPIGGFGDAEVFSLSPTKLVVAGEGGLVTTNDDELAQSIRVGRDYGNPGNYDSLYPGLNARMGELNAVLALATLHLLPKNVMQRNYLARVYQSELSQLPGISFQHTLPETTTTYKDFAIVIDPDAFGVSRDELAESLRLENIMTRKYFDPPLHRQTAYESFREEYHGKLSITEHLAANILSLPMFSHMDEETVYRICATIRNIHRGTGR